jgi:Helix-turn-helix domain
MPNRGHGWCPACYGRWYRAGMPDGPPPAPWTAQPLDGVAIELAVKGTRPRLTPQERRAAVAELRERGLSLSAVADRLGCSQRTVERHTAAIRTEA